MSARRRSICARGSLALVLALAGSLPACSYWDVGYLQRCRDGGCDDGSVSEAGPDAVAPCQAPADATYDVPAAFECTSRESLDLVALANRVGPSLVVQGNTAGAPATLHPPDTTFPSCNDTYSTPNATSGERVYRYVVERGPRIVATTDAPDCIGSFDTLLYIRTSCDQDVGDVLDCSDDDQVLGTCGAGMTSSAVAGGLVPGQVIYFVVDGYGANSGAFRLVVTENAGLNAPPPATADMLMGVDRCSCPATADTQQATVQFPSTDDAYVAANAPDFATPGDMILGTRTLPFSHISGVALDGLCLERNDLMVNDACRGITAVIDLMIADRVVQSFRVLPGASTAVPVSVGFQTFGGITVPTDRPVDVALRLRAITPTAGCGSVRFGLTSATLTLLGQP